MARTIARSRKEIAGIALMAVGGSTIAVLAFPVLFEFFISMASGYLETWKNETNKMALMHAGFIFFFGYGIYRVGEVNRRNKGNYKHD